MTATYDYDIGWVVAPAGSPADRGSADKYYGRPPRPHCIRDGSGGYVGMLRGYRCEDLTPEERDEYLRAWDAEDDKKDWG